MARDEVSFVTGPMTGGFAVPNGLQTAIKGSFLTTKRQNYSRFGVQVQAKPCRRTVLNINMTAGDENPLDQAELGRRQNVSVTAETMAAAAPSGPISVPVAELQLPMGSLKMREVEGRTQIVAEVDEGGVPFLEPPKPRITALSPDDIRVRAIDGPGGAPSGVSSVSYFPTRAPREGMKIPEGGPRRKRGGTIFGVEDRFTFIPSAYPWRITGQIRTAVGRCTGTCIGPRHVLTASHCVNWTDSGAGWISFSPGYYDGNRPYGEHFATDIIYWNKASGGLTDLETAFDYVVLVMPDYIGNTVGYAGYRTYNGGWNGGSYWQYIGYAADLASGERPAFQNNCAVSTNQPQTLSGRSAFVLGHFNDFTPGQSGGSAWGWWGDEIFPRVVGVGSTIGSFSVEPPHNSTIGDNEYGGGRALSDLITYTRENYP